jgi:5-methylcytosine-specific restriction endonuclease McrA
MPTRPANPCPVCRHLPPCPHGRRVRPPEQRRGRGTYAWQKLSKQVLADWRRVHGDWCPGWGRASHYTRNLTVDHVLPLARGGDLTAGPLAVLCARCNARKGAG